MSKQYPIQSEDIPYNSYKPRAGDAPPAGMVRDNARRRGIGQMNIYKLTAGLAQLMSYLTTLWAVEWVWSDGQPLHRYVAAFAIELLLTAMKLTLFDGKGSNDGIGWSGMVIDVITNTGGAIMRAGMLITWAPIAILLSVIGVYDWAISVMATTNGHAITNGGAIIAVIGGILLAVAPHYLWRRGE